MQRVIVIIPARYASTRLPGKPLALLAGKPMIQHVVERALQIRGAEQVLVAADDVRVAQVVRDFGGDVLMTSPDHPSGTDRLVEVMASVQADGYINVQGDEPFLRPADVDVLIEGMRADETVGVGTLCHPLPLEEAGDPNAVKVVLAANGDTLYFSRSPIPFDRDGPGVARYFKHVGIYGYRREVLANYSQLPRPMIEEAEKLEQLRLLHAGIRLRAWTVEPTGPGIDTPECLERARRLLEASPLE
jgi:3-deoxy-manno-octulosonate cytidylyltransferase (CMP-KDO synthetase)